MRNYNDLNKPAFRKDYNKSLNVIKRLILNGFSEDNFDSIQFYMNKIAPNTSPDHLRALGEFVRNSYTDDVDTKSLNELVRQMKLEEQ